MISELLAADHTQSLPPSSITKVKSEEVKNLCQEEIRVKRGCVNPHPHHIHPRGLEISGNEQKWMTIKQGKWQYRSV